MNTRWAFFPYRTVLLLAAALPGFAQYSGPALLTRGQAPAAMATPAIEFRPFIEFSGIYDTGLSNVSVSETGELANQSSYGARLTWGVSGVHSWRRTQLGVDYRGSVTRYSGRRFGQMLNQNLMLGFTRAVTRHTQFRLRQTAGVFSRDFGVAGLYQTVPFDPDSAVVPQTDFFDNRTAYLNTSGDFSIQKSMRLSFNLGGAGFITARRSRALYDVFGGSAFGDVHYRLSRRTTLGAVYDFTHFEFGQGANGSDLHRTVGSFGIRLSRWWEVTGYGGAVRVESKFVRSVAVDPVIAALLGITSSSQIVHSLAWIPNGGVRLTRTLSRGVIYISAGRSVTPGNGLFLTSDVTSVMAGYSYTGLRNWSFSTNAKYSSAESIANIRGEYQTATGGATMSRRLGRSLHVIMTYSARRYSSPDFERYHRVIHQVVAGIGFTPGEIPLRVW